MRAPTLIIFILLMVIFAAACDKTETNAGPDNPSGLNEQRLRLSEGYSLLHTDASHIDLIKLVLYVKFESEEFNKIITEISNYGGELEKDLERIAKEYPGVRINLDPLPQVEQRKRRAIANDRARYFAPLIGRGGREYERTMLISLANAINHERHLCQIMAEEEPDPQLRKFLLDTQKRFDDLYDKTVALLDREHFKDPNGKSQP